MSDDSGNDDKDKDKVSGKLISFPGGKSVDPDSVGADFVLSGVGYVPTPDIVDPACLERELKDRINFVRNQELVQLAHKGASTYELIDAVLCEVVEEAAHLKYDRRKAAKDGKSTVNVSGYIINSLRSIAEILIKRRDSSLSERLDVKSPRFQAIFKIWMEFFYSSMEKCGVSSEIIDLVFNQMKADMVDWEQRMSSTNE
jgi:hypothetical protein